MQNWEYKTTEISIDYSARTSAFDSGLMKVRISREEIEKHLNWLGAEGWELVSTNWGKSAIPAFVCFWKRPKQ
ncbi:uncharacterized protein METZ01_LOCUS346467 [marine metagenome]|uniref:DUF4177 domain-containing protein n=1 Tax=marine metagenome TaxID=408172 RepID=A0A382R799_9ZZZZ